jgi:hypothetical protein
MMRIITQQANSILKYGRISYMPVYKNKQLRISFDYPEKA